MRADQHGEKRFGAVTLAAEWDARYSEQEGAMWSGRPNGRLQAEVAGEAAVRALLDTVRPGGLLLAVYHDLDDDHREHMKSRGTDPAAYVGADDLDQLLGDDFTVELHAVEPRIDPPPETPHIADVVLRARRRYPRGPAAGAPDEDRLHSSSPAPSIGAD
jgi:hypothetical protein